MGVARGDEPRAAARETTPSRTGAHDPRRDLQLVHRGLRHRRPEGCESIARGTEWHWFSLPVTPKYYEKATFDNKAFRANPFDARGHKTRKSDEALHPC